MKPVMAVGAPSYTSGVHTWNGTAPILNSRPTATRAVPARSSGVNPRRPLRAAAMPENEMVPA